MTSQLSPEDIALFRAAVSGVKPLKVPATIPLNTQKTKKILLRSKQKVNETNAPSFQQFSRATEAFLIKSAAYQSGAGWEKPVYGETTLIYAVSGLQARLLRQLRQGKLQICASLDLHGQTLIQTERHILHFIEQAQGRQFRCVHIIHGKGTPDAAPPLKNYLNTCLRAHPAVLAFCSAQSKNGGTGAIYVLLRLPSLV